MGGGVMGNFEQRPTGWSVRYRDNDNRQRRKGGFRTKRDAEAWLSERMKEMRDGFDLDHGMTFNQLADIYMQQHYASHGRKERLRYALEHARSAFGRTRIEDLTTPRIRAWRNGLATPAMQYTCLGAVKQVLNFAVDEKVLRESPADRISRPMPPAADARPFDTWDEVLAVEEGLPEWCKGLAIFMVGTGLRPQEWPKLEWRHVDLERRALILPNQIVKPKTPARKVPLRQMVVDALAALPHREGLVWRSEHGGPIHIGNWRDRQWYPALELAGLEARRPYDCRHTYATWCLRAGMNTFQLARRMGTSLEMIDRTYGKEAMDGEEREQFLMDAFDGISSLPTAPGHELVTKSRQALEPEVS